MTQSYIRRLPPIANHDPLIDCRCEAKQRCEIPVKAGIFGDACPGTNKYVEVHYTCQPVRSAETTPKPLPPWLLDLAATPGTTSTTTTTLPTTSSQETTTTSTTTVATTTTRRESSTRRRESTTSASTTPRLSTPAKDGQFTDSDIEVLEELVGHCPPQTSRNLFWNWTASGQEAIQVCPPGSNGFARWKCGMDGAWTTELPNLSECQSLWLSRLESRMHANEAINSIGAELAARSQTKSLYGGDLPIVATIIQGLAHRLRQELYVIPQQEDKEIRVAELLQNVLKTASNLLDDSQLLAWNELQREKRAGISTAMLLGLEENALLLAETINNEKTLTQASNNILASLRVMRARDIDNQPFPETGSNSKLVVPAASLVETSVNGAVRIVFFLYNNLEAILPGSGTHFVNSKVLGAVVAKGHTMSLSYPVLFTLRHLQSENVRNHVCAAWDYAHRAWTDKGCSSLKTNATHTVCQCKRISVYAVLMEEQPSAVPHSAVDDSAGSGGASGVDSATDMGGVSDHMSTIITSIVAIVLSLVILIIALILIKRFDLKPRVQKFVQANSGGGGIFRCKKSESTTSSCGFYPPLTSSPTSTTVSSGTPTNQTYLEQVLKAHNSEYKPANNNTNGTTVTASNSGSVLAPTVIYGRAASVAGPQQPQHHHQQVHPTRHLVALNQYDPFGHHIYMEIDPVYAHLEAEQAHSDIQLSDISDDGDHRNRLDGGVGGRQRFAEERPLIGSHQHLPADPLFQQQQQQQLQRQCMTTHRLRMPPASNAAAVDLAHNGSLRLINAGGSGAGSRTAVPRNLEAPITIALQGGEQFVSLKIDQDKREQKRAAAAAAAARAAVVQQQQQQLGGSGRKSRGGGGIYR